MDDGQVDAYGPDVGYLIDQDDIGSYLMAADAIMRSGAQLLLVQHEYGIYGGEAGSHLLALVNRVTIPVALTLHTILETPTEAQRRVLDALLARAATVIVMAEAGREILARVHNVDPARIEVIPHGIPDRPLPDPTAARRKLGLPEQPTVLTFGLLSPDKGIADMIEAMPRVVAECPDVRYLVLGATHPHLVRQEGEAYRASLTARIAELGLEKNVELVNRFVAADVLTDWLAAADVYVTPYRNPAQITSGTLSYAVGLGKPVVSTPYAHAREILSDDHGIIVPFRAPEALGAAVARLLGDAELRWEIAARAYARGRTMIWTRNAEAVMTAIARGLQGAGERPASRAALRLTLSPILRLTDDTGLLQHSILGIPDRRHGYCIDDNARALILMSLADDLPAETRIALATIYASFVQHAWNPDARRFRNFMGYDRGWLETEGSEDSNGRTLWALTTCARRGPSAALRAWALDLYHRTASAIGPLSSPRALAFQMLAAAEMCALRPGDAAACALLREGAARLTALLAVSSRPDWTWFEIVLSYDNTRLAEALIRAGQALGARAITEAGIAALDWISRRTTGADGCFQPVGTESFGEALATPGVFDQQPLEAWAAIDACAAAWDATGDALWLTRAQAAHDWFLGANTLSQSIVDSETGECHDGLTRFGVNLNQGAESAIAWQAGHRAYRALLESSRMLQNGIEPLAEVA
jgi:glycosyltransferase involved in cell wall biosynthesis